MRLRREGWLMVRTRMLHPRRVMSAVLTAVALVAAGSVIAQAGHGTTVASYTGCLDVQGAGAGAVLKVKLGTAPLSTCGSGYRLIHLSGGDLSAVLTPAAGGLSGGKSNGTATLALRPSYRLPQSCAASSIARWTGSAWLCSQDEDTTYTAGEHLDLVGSQFDVTGAPWGGLENVPAGFADQIDDVATMPGHSRVFADAANGVGSSPSAAIGTDGRPLISYYDNTDDDLKVAHCLDLACTSATTTAIDTVGDVGVYTSIAIGADGFGLISYQDNVNWRLKVAHCENIACTTATVTTLDSAAQVGFYTSLAIGRDGYGLIAYWAAGAFGDLRVAHCTNTACTAADLVTLDSTGITGRMPSVTIGADGLGLISYAGVTDLKAAHCVDVACTSATTSLLDTTGDVGEWTSITVGTDGLGLISYRDTTNGGLKVAHCSNVLCTAATATTLGTINPSDIQNTSITLGADGMGLVLYRDHATASLAATHCSNVLCNVATTVTGLDTVGVQSQLSVTVGADGQPFVAYRGGGALRALHCSNPQCVPFTRRR